MRYVGDWGVKSCCGPQQRDYHLGAKLPLISSSLNAYAITREAELIFALNHVHSNSYSCTQTETHAHVNTRWLLVTPHAIASVSRAHKAVCCWSRFGPRNAIHRTAIFHHHLHGNHALSHRDNEFHLGLVTLAASSMLRIQSHFPTCPSTLQLIYHMLPDQPPCLWPPLSHTLTLWTPCFGFFSYFSYVLYYSLINQPRRSVPKISWDSCLKIHFNSSAPYIYSSLAHTKEHTRHPNYILPGATETNQYPCGGISGLKFAVSVCVI